MSASFENLESKMIFLKIDLKKSPLIQNMIQDSLSELFNLYNMYLDLSTLRVTSSNTCTIFAIANFAKCNDPLVKNLLTVKVV